MADAKHDPFPELDKVRQAVKRLYDIAIEMPFDLDQLAKHASGDFARGFAKALDEWSDKVKAAYGTMPQDPPIKYDPENEPDPNPKLSPDSLLGCLLAGRSLDDVVWNRWEKRPLTPIYASTLLGVPPEELLRPNNRNYLADGENLGPPSTISLPEWAGEVFAKDQWELHGFQGWAHWAKSVFFDERRKALALVKWTQDALAAFESITLPSIRLLVSGPKKALEVKAVVTQAGFTQSRELTTVIGDFVYDLKTKGKAKTSPKNKATLKKQLPELWPYVVPTGPNSPDRREFLLHPPEVRARISIERAKR